MKNEKIKLTIELDTDQAWSLAQIFKRISFSEYEELSTSNDQAWSAMYGAETIRQALAAAGIDPR